MGFAYGLLFKRAIDDQIVGLVSFSDQGTYALTERQKLSITKDAELFDLKLQEFTQTTFIKEKYKLNKHETKIPDNIFRKKLMNIAKLFNSNEFDISGYELLAYPVALSKDYENKKFPYYEIHHKYSTNWTYAFLADKRFHFKGFKTLGFTTMFSCDKDLLDVVDLEEFNKIDDRLPLFLGTMCGRFPYFEKIPGFFNGDKYMGVISKSLLSGSVFGMTLYYVPKTTTFIGRSSTAGSTEVASY